MAIGQCICALALACAGHDLHSRQAAVRVCLICIKTACVSADIVMSSTWPCGNASVCLPGLGTT